jgi:hypothetical protein
MTTTAVIFTFPRRPSSAWVKAGRRGKAKIMLEKQEQSVAKECRFLV